MSSHLSLNAAADERKARLAKLQALKRKAPDDSPAQEPSPKPTTRSRSASPTESPDASTRYLSGRNYDATTRGPKLGFEAPPTELLDKPTLEQQAAQVEDDLRRKAEEDAQDDKGVDLFKLQPKRPNWDLKRDLEARLQPLNVRTDNAIARLVRARIGAQDRAAHERQANGAAASSTEGVGIEGVTLVESVKQREREEQDDERREREDDDLI